MANIKQQIIDWFNGPQDYNKGLTLLEQVSKKNKVLGKLIQRGESKSTTEKLVWELNKVAGLKKVPKPSVFKVIVKKTAANIKPSKEKKAPTTKKTGNEDGLRYNLIGTRSIESYPPEVRRLVKEYSSLYMQRGKKHAALKRLGDGNEQAIVDQRKILIDEIAKIKARLDILYKAFDDYDSRGISFDPDVLWPEGNKEVSDKPETGLKGLSIEDLKTLKKNIQSSITKDRNLLLYGGKTKPEDGKENPMPASPKRIKLEKRVAKKEADILAIDTRIAELG